MSYKSPCDHPHDDMICNYTVWKTGTIRLQSYNQSLWGITGGYTKEWVNGNEQMTFKPFQTSIKEMFEYSQETDCGCRFYVPSENLEYLEWKYSEHNKST